MPRSLQIFVLGPFRVAVDGVDVDTRALMTKYRSKQLVKLLALQPDLSLHRDQIVDALWPDAAPDAGVHRFYKTLYEARHALEPALKDGRRSLFLLSLNQRITLSAPEGVWVDAHEFKKLAAEAIAGDARAAHEALQLYRGDLLAEDIYDDRVDLARRMLLDLRRTLVHRVTESSIEVGELDTATASLASLLEVDPADEETHRRLMRVFALSGDRTRALEQFRRCSDALREHLGAGPDVETISLVDRIRSGDSLVGEERSNKPQMANRPPSNLQYPLTSFVGRRRETEQVQHLLDQARLVTITGTGGIGKTRLAQVVAARVLDRFPAGAWFADFAAVSDPHLVAQTVAATLGVSLRSTTPPVKSISRAMGSGRVLLVLDNCERVLESVADLGDSLLRECSGLRLLATSRAVLDVEGEAVLPLPPLEVTAPGATADVYESEAACLFVDRARLSAPTYDLGPREAYAVAEICRHLDGIPLAIELAAARLMYLTVGQVLERLGDRFRLLSVETRTVEPRHRTIRAVIDWSHDLLDGSERVLFRRLSLFSGGWTLAAAEQVCADESLPGVFDVLGRLVAQSLVLVEREETESRYRYLETLREYAAEKLEESGEREEIAARHAAWCLALAESADSFTPGAHTSSWLDLMETEIDNMRVALAGTTTGEPHAWQTGLRLASQLAPYWFLRAHFSEGRAWMDRALEAADGLADAELQSKALLCAARLAMPQGESAHAKKLLEQALNLYDRGRDSRELAHTVALLGEAERALLEYDRAKEHLEEALAMHTRMRNRTNIAFCLHRLGMIAHFRKDAALMMSYLEQALQLYRDVGAVHAAASIVLDMGFGTVQMDPVAAERHFSHAMATLTELGDESDAARAKEGLGIAMREQGRFAESLELLRQALDVFEKLGEYETIFNTLEDVACVAAGMGSCTVALRLVSSVSSLRRDYNVPRDPVAASALNKWLARCGEHLDSHKSEGATMTIEEAMAFARTIATTVDE